MTLTNPGAITNSGSKQFTNQFATVAKINYNRALNDAEYQAYQNFTWYAINRRKHEPYCGECNNLKSSVHKHKKVHSHKNKVHSHENKVHSHEKKVYTYEKKEKVHVKKDNYFVALLKKVFLR